MNVYHYTTHANYRYRNQSRRDRNEWEHCDDCAIQSHKL